MTKITININTDNGKPEITTKVDNAATDVPKVESSKEEPAEVEKKEETPPQKESSNEESSEKGGPQKMDMTEEEHAQMSTANNKS